MLHSLDDANLQRRNSELDRAHQGLINQYLIYLASVVPLKASYIQMY